MSKAKSMRNPTQSLTIKSMYTDNDVSLFVDTADYVWIMGCNTNDCLGVESDQETMTKAVRTSIHLNPEESIVRFYQYGMLTAIYTSSKRLFISRVTKPSGRDGYGNKAGVYPISRLSNIQLDDQPLIATPYQEFSWPESAPIDFTMSYAMYETKSEPVTELVAETKSEPAIEIEGKPVTETRTKPVADTKSKTKSKPKSDTKSKPKSDSKHKPEATDEAILDRMYANHSSDEDVIDEDECIPIPKPVGRGRDPYDLVRYGFQKPSPNNGYSYGNIYGSSQYTYSNQVKKQPKQDKKGRKQDKKGRKQVSSDEESEEVEDYDDYHESRSRCEASDDLDELFDLGTGSSSDADGCDPDRMSDSESESEDMYLDQTQEPENDLLRDGVPDRRCLSSHDFGSGMGHDNYEFNYTCGRLVSVHYADKPGFVDALEGVENVAFSNETVFFQLGSEHYVYNWSLTWKQAMDGLCGIKLRPTQHAKVLTYYQLCPPFQPSTVSYQDGFLYMHSDNDTHHVLTGCYDDDGKSIISWHYFCLSDLTPNSIYVSSESYNLKVLKDGKLYQYLSITGELELVMDLDVKSISVDWNHTRAFVCVSKKGFLTEYPSTSLCKDNDLIKDLVGTSNNNSDSSAGFLLVDSELPDRYLPRADIMCINIRGVLNHKPITNGILIYDENRTLYLCTTSTRSAPKFLCKVSDYKTSRGTYTVYALTNISPFTEMHTSQNRLVFRVTDKVYKCDFNNGMPGSCSEIMGEIPFSMATVDPSLISRPSTPSSNKVAITVETCADKLDRLASIAEMFGSDTKVSISYAHRSKSVSYGAGVNRVFIQDALAQFASTYLIKHSACTELNLPAFEGMTAHKMYTYGRMLHMAMTLLGSALPLRVPTALLTAIKGREPVIDELEYLVQKERPDSFESMHQYRTEPSSLAACGYTSYQECLETAIHYNAFSPESNQTARAICKQMADGFLAYHSIKNRELMNFPTLDCYLSGPYTIDREHLKTLINGPSDLCEFMRKHIQTLPEDRLAVLLKNWTGTSVLMADARYRVEYKQSHNIHFSTCSTILGIPKELVKGTAPGISCETLVDLLTTPTNHITG